MTPEDLDRIEALAEHCAAVGYVVPKPVRDSLAAVPALVKALRRLQAPPEGLPDAEAFTRLARLVDVRDAPAVTLHADDAHDLHAALMSLTPAVQPESLEPAEVFVDRLWTRMNPDQMEREIRARDAFWQRTAAVFAVRANEQECHHAA
ncbi:MAG TPA: hypothetical protein VLS49_03795, partial [Usitatibacter sp.]|nr:hypothetical protein [Usitatibacter sp.]